MMLERARSLITLLACLALAIAAPAAAQKPTFDIEGVVSDAQQAVLPGATVTLHEHRHRAHPRTVHRRGRPLRLHVAADGRPGTAAGGAAGIRHRGPRRPVFNAGQRALINFTMQAVDGAGNDHRRRRRANRADDNIRSDKNDRTPAIRNAAGEGAQLLPAADARLERRRAGTGSNAVNVGGQEVWNFGTYVDGTNNYSKWLTLQRAPQLGSSGFALETVKEVQLITNQFSAEFGGHSAGVTSMITKSGTNKVTARRS